MQRSFINFFIFTIIFQSIIFGHCQVPCGIYDDASRIIQIQEDFRTIKKAMGQIILLNSKSSAQDSNQLIRWINTKEEHANNIQKILTEYFLVQRIKPSNKKYIDQISTIHQVLILAMKCKQTVAVNYVDDGINIIEKFIDIYFDKHGKDHLNSLNKIN
tara:strand:- start:3067 stop:3543 length:477 start_codon:yes stop_codon:yes gene_type:complete